MIVTIAICCFAASGLCGITRLLRGPGLADRVMALDVTLMSLMSLIALDAARRDDATFIIVAVVLAIIGFTATAAASRFIEGESGSSGFHKTAEVQEGSSR